MAKNQISFVPDNDVKASIAKFSEKWKLNKSRTINRIILLFKESQK